MNNATHYRTADKGDNFLRDTEHKTREAALEEASDVAASRDVPQIIYQAIALVKPERAPVSVTPLA